MKRLDFLKKDIVWDCVCVVLVMLGIYTAISAFTGTWAWSDNPYNSYVLQAQRWTQGFLDLGRDYPYLELAIYNGKYYVSFPPFPSVVYLPFVLVSGTAPEGFIALASALCGAVYMMKLLKRFNITGTRAVMWTLLITAGSNLLFVCLNAWVWFIAQNMAFTLSIMAFYYAYSKKGGLSLFFWACAVGCRPFNALHIFLLLYILYNALKKDEPDITIVSAVKKYWKWGIACFCTAVFYMVLNFLRFGNPIEFGHNYLPEFMRMTTGQFNTAYLGDNLKSLIKLPGISEGKWDFPLFDGMNIFIVSPVFAVWIISTVWALIRNRNADKRFLVIALLTVAAQLFVICMHKSMGGSHFGNRYTNDTLPVVIAAVLTAGISERAEKFVYPLAAFGAAVNIIGAVMFYTNSF